MTIDDLAIGQSGVISQVGGEGPLRLRFLDMGLIPVRVTMAENTLELVSRVFLLVLPLYSENSELFRGKIFL